MDWVRKPDLEADPENETRKLTPEEIQKIIDEFPAIEATDTLTAQKVREGITEWVAKDLREIKITPSALGELQASIYMYHLKSLVQAETSVGITAAEATGATTTQMTLNMFHVSGSSKSMSFGVDAMKELIFARLTRRHESSMIYFRDSTLTSEDVVTEMRPKIIGSIISDFIGVTLMDENGAAQHLDYDIDVIQALPRYWWHEDYSILRKKVIPQSTHVLRLYLDVDKLYAMKISLDNMANILEKEVIDKETERSVVVIHSPLVWTLNGRTMPPIMDIYPDPSMMKKVMANKQYIPEDIATQTFLKCFVLPDLSRIRVGGISGIRRLFPIVSPVWQIVLEEKKATTAAFSVDEIPPDIDRMWVLVYNKIRMAISGVTVSTLARLLRVVGIEIRGGNDSVLLVVMPEGVMERPGEYVQRLQNAARTEQEAEISRIREEAQNRGVSLGIIKPPRKEILEASEYVYADSDGSNLLDLLAHHDVDPTRTISNNMHEIARVLGIEATRNFFIYDFNNVIQNAESYVNYRHIALLADFITGRGRPLGITFFGISRQRAGHLTLATIERATPVLGHAALFGKEEESSNVSAAIAVGRRVPIGTGGVDVEIDQKKLMEFEQRMTQLRTATPADRPRISLSSLKEAVDELEGTASVSTVSEIEGEDHVDMVNLFNTSEVLVDITGRQGIVAPRRGGFTLTAAPNVLQADQAPVSYEPRRAPVISNLLSEVSKVTVQSTKREAPSRFTLRAIESDVLQEPLTVQDEIPEPVQGTGLPSTLIDMMGQLNLGITPAPDRPDMGVNEPLTNTNLIDIRVQEAEQEAQGSRAEITTQTTGALPQRRRRVDLSKLLS